LLRAVPFPSPAASGLSPVGQPFALLHCHRCSIAAGLRWKLESPTP